MSLSKEEKKELAQLSEYFKKIEKLALANNIDLDVYMTEYKENGYAVYSTERISRKTNSDKRKNVFEKEEKEKLKGLLRNH